MDWPSPTNLRTRAAGDECDDIVHCTREHVHLMDGPHHYATFRRDEVPVPTNRMRGAHYEWGVYLSEDADVVMSHLFLPPHHIPELVEGNPLVIRVRVMWTMACEQTHLYEEVPTWRINQPRHEQTEFLCKACWDWARR